MVSPELHKHLQAEMDHMVKEMTHAGLTWSDMVETLEALVQQEWWHLNGFLELWLG